MKDLRQAAKRALKAMEDGEYRADMIEFSDALIALRAALAEPEQEPVAWMDIDDKGQKHGLRYYSDGSSDEVPLYTAPTPRKPDLETLNAELVEALKHAAECVQSNYLPDKCGHDWDDVIAKAEANK